MILIVCGGAGFIGSNFVRMAMRSGHKVIVVDALTYAGSIKNLPSDNVPPIPFYKFDINQRDEIFGLLNKYSPTAIINFAAESHVDRSISGSSPFLQSNVAGTLSLLEASTEYFASLKDEDKDKFRYFQISTDEVYGSLGFDDVSFTENHQIAPNNPYSASKAAADHFVRAFGKTHKLPILITHCSNNYGPRQHSEKLVPATIKRALSGQKLRVYGDGSNVRDWLHVDDHCEAVLAVLERGLVGERYNIGGGHEISNLSMVSKICKLLDRLCPSQAPYASQIEFVGDRKGHDLRYSINCSKLESELGWSAKVEFDQGLESVVRWYLDRLGGSGK